MRAHGPIAVTDWREDAFRMVASLQGSMPGLAATTLAAIAPAPCTGENPSTIAWVMFATPTHYVPEMSNVRLAQDGILTLTAKQAQALAVDFNRVWHDAGIHLRAADSGVLFVLWDRPLTVVTRDPEDMRDSHLHHYFPSGKDAGPLRQLMSEIEMWLFDHPVNRVRLQAGSAAITGLWLWGGGPPIAARPDVDGRGAGDDPFFASLMRRGENNGSDSAVIVAADEPGSDAWRDIEANWLTPGIEQLRDGRLTRIDLSAGSTAFQVTARRSWRFWQRPQPWWEYFER
jgi:hypothetical protein